jgi:hypothetical protein
MFAIDASRVPTRKAGDRISGTRGDWGSYNTRQPLEAAVGLLHFAMPGDLQALQSAMPSRATNHSPFLEGLNADFAKLRNDRRAWAEEQSEREAWDATLADDLTEGT